MFQGICHSHYTCLNFGGILGTILQKDEPMVTTTCFFHVGGFFTGVYAMIFHQFFYHMFGTGFKLEVLLDTIKEKKPKQVRQRKIKQNIFPESN